METIDLQVRYRSGTYITQRVRGQQASCTVSPEDAAKALGRKIFTGDIAVSYQGECTVKGKHFTLWQIQGE